MGRTTEGRARVPACLRTAGRTQVSHSSQTAVCVFATPASYSNVPVHKVALCLGRVPTNWRAPCMVWLTDMTCGWCFCFWRHPDLLGSWKANTFFTLITESLTRKSESDSFYWTFFFLIPFLPSCLCVNYLVLKGTHLKQKAALERTSS